LLEYLCLAACGEIDVAAVERKRRENGRDEISIHEYICDVE
jgi:hypothetical protein